MTTAYDLRHITPTPHSERVALHIHDHYRLDEERIDVICGDLSLSVEHRTVLHRGLATTDIQAVELYVSDCCRVAFALPADLEIRLINHIEAYFEQQAERYAQEDAFDRRMAVYVERMEDTARYSAA